MIQDQPRRHNMIGGAIDRDKPITFKFDGEKYFGFEGDTLASALLANGVSTVGRSFKYHRRRGVFSIGSEEPNALCILREGARAEPNTRMTQVEIYPGLVAKSQNRWPSLDWDLLSVNSLVSPFLAAGFYYKTFMRPKGFWEKYEVLIRKAAGLGTASGEADPDRYEKAHRHVDVLIVGAGPAGLAAAKAAMQTGARVAILDEREAPGGWLRFDRELIDAAPSDVWLDEAVESLRASGNVLLLTRTTAFGYYDHNFVAAVERVQDHSAVPDPSKPRQRLWTFRAKRVILATGSIEQPLAFADNDLPGVMLAGAVRGYLNAYGVTPGRKTVLFTNNDSAYRTALDILMAGGAVEAIVDMRANPSSAMMRAVRDLGVPVYSDSIVTRARGGRALTACDVMPRNGDQMPGGRPVTVECDTLGVSGGWSPAVHLHSQTGAPLTWREADGVFVPTDAPHNCVSIGAATGMHDLSDCLNMGSAAGTQATVGATGRAAVSATPDVFSLREEQAMPIREIPLGPAVGLSGRGKRFVDLQNDVTVEDIKLAHQEGFVSVEHMKRYTTLGMATDQGKTSNLTALTIMARQRGVSPDKVGTTKFRPPYTPVAIGAIAGQERGAHYRPLRRTPMDAWHAARGAVFQNTALWRRPHYYPKTGETIDDASAREVLATRQTVGVCDVTTLGKIDIQGPDAALFLNRVYTNGFAKLPIGKARYGVMVREDGMVFDDGVTSRLGETQYLMTTTTGNAGPVLSKLEFYLQTVWPDLDVQVTSVTEQWACFSIAGPKSRDLLSGFVDLDISDAAFPFMAVAACTFAGVPARLFRISFSGERAYEVAVPSDYGEEAWSLVVAEAERLGGCAYGLEALGTMRIEKGHVAGTELNGQTTPSDLGLDGFLSSKKSFIGKAMLDRPAYQSTNRQKLVGLKPVDGKTPIKAGAQIVEDPYAPRPVPMLGHVTAVAYSPELQSPIALALVAGGLDRLGDTLHAAYPLLGETVLVEVVSPHFLDPEGERMHG